MKCRREELELLIVNESLFYRFKPNEGVIVVGATNFAEALDKYVCCFFLSENE